MPSDHDVISSLINIAVPWWELVVRGIVVYVFLLLMLRISGKRQVGQLSPFDLVLLLILSNAVQNSMNAGDNSLVGGLASATTLIGINYVVGLITSRNKKMSAFIEGKPQILVHNGKVDEQQLLQTQMTHHELNAALRKSGYSGVEEVRFAVLENDGEVSVIGYTRTPLEHATTPAEQ